jgi:hypothetical protein
MEIFKFRERSLIYHTGAKLVLEGLSTYGKEITSAGIPNVPMTCLTPYGANLNAKINAAKIVVAEWEVGILPDDKVIETAKAARMGNVGSGCR